MVQFNIIDIVDNRLIIDCSIAPCKEYERMFIRSVTIDTDSTYKHSLPSDAPIYRKEFENLPLIIEGLSTINLDVDVFQENSTRGFRLELSQSSLNSVPMDSTIFFVYVEVGGFPDPSISCKEDKSLFLGVAYNKPKALHPIVTSISTLEICKEDVPKAVIDSILRYRIFDMAMRVGDFPNAIKYWNKFFKNATISNTLNKCKCNGEKPL